MCAVQQFDQYFEEGKKLDTGEKFLWLDNSDERKYMSDREILRKYINLDNTCLTEDEKEEVMNMFFK